MVNRARAVRITLPVILLISFFTATIVIYKHLGDIMLDISKDQVIPYILTTDDITSGCAMTDAFVPVLSSISQNSRSGYQLAILLDYLSGSCAEFKAWEEELRYLRASYAKNVVEAQDARIRQKRLLNQAARKQYKAFLNLDFAFKEKSASGCPDLNIEQGEFYWLIGILGGLQAILNDLSSEGGAQVPLDIVFKVSRSATCLNNQKWWGVPKAIQAAIWTSFPNNKPAGIEPLKILQQSMQIGLQQRVRIAQVLAARVYIGLGEIAQVKNMIRQNEKVWFAMVPNSKFKFLDTVAILQMQAISDRLWTRTTGKRTPIGGLGSFSEDKKNPVDTVDINDIL